MADSQLGTQQQAVEPLYEESKRVITMFLKYRLSQSYYLNKDGVVCKLTFKEIEEGSKSEQELINQLLTISMNNLTPLDHDSIRRVGDACVQFSRSEVASCFRESFRKLFPDKCIYWERIVMSLEFASSIAAHTTLLLVHIINILADCFDNTKITQYGDTINRCIETSGGWKCLITKNSDKQVPTKLNQSRTLVPYEKEKTCTCGTKIRIPYMECCRCLNCQRFVCMYPMCSFESSEQESVHDHYKTSHSGNKQIEVSKTNLSKIYIVKSCSCGESRSIFKEQFIECPVCSKKVCTVPGCDVSSDSISKISSHNHEPTRLMAGNKKVIKNLKSKPRCSCGNLLPIRSTKIIQCLKCEQYICNYEGCDYGHSKRLSVKSHQSRSHSKETFINRNNINFCVCGYPKQRETGRPFIFCPNPDCDYYWCLADNCDRIFLYENSVRGHIRLDHNVKTVFLDKQCSGCQDMYKAEDKAAIEPFCQLCGYFVCLNGTCTRKFESEQGLKNHQYRAHSRSFHR